MTATPSPPPRWRRALRRGGLRGLGPVAPPGAYIAVADPLKALEKAGIVARARTAQDRRHHRLGRQDLDQGDARPRPRARGPHPRPPKSFNNHIGVPLTLARMPAGAEFGVFEIGMNHAGEITPLTRMVRPDVAVITAIEAVHIENLGSIEAIADAKAEIFVGVEHGGVAVLPRDNRFYERLAKAARAAGIETIVSFGEHEEADVSASCASCWRRNAPPSMPASWAPTSPTSSARRASTSP